MKKKVQAVLNLIKDLLLKLVKNPAVVQGSKPEKTSNGYEIYYDINSGEAVGIVYKNIVFLKQTSKYLLYWTEAVEYCKSIIINGITSQLCPVDDIWKEEFERNSQCLYDALKEIGAKHLNSDTWGTEYSCDHVWAKYFHWCKENYAWGLCFLDGNVDWYYKTSDRYYVRPVLVLDR